MPVSPPAAISQDALRLRLRALIRTANRAACQWAAAVSSGLAWFFETWSTGRPPRRGYLWRVQLLGGEMGSAELARQAGVSARYVMRMMRLGFLAPDLIEAILEGRQSAAMTLAIVRHPLPLLWSEQRLLLGFVE